MTALAAAPNSQPPPVSMATPDTNTMATPWQQHRQRHWLPGRADARELFLCASWPPSFQPCHGDHQQLWLEEEGLSCCPEVARRGQLRLVHHCQPRAGGAGPPARHLPASLGPHRLLQVQPGARGAPSRGQEPGRSQRRPPKGRSGRALGFLPAPSRISALLGWTKAVGERWLGWAREGRLWSVGMG